MARKKNAERELHWRGIVNRQAGSGLSIREYCAKEGISQPSFFAWRKRLGTGESDGRQVSKPNGREKADGGSEFIPLRLQDSASALVVIHPLGYQVRVTGDVTLRALREVLEVLDGRLDG